nr:hypothetical protein [Cryobacterium breve]
MTFITSLEIPFGDVEEPHRRVHAGVVEVDVEAAEAGDGRFDGGPHRFAVRDVSLYRRRSTAARHDVVRDELACREVEVGDHHVGAFGGDAPRDGGSDSGCAPRDDDGLLGKSIAHVFCSFAVRSLVSGRSRGLAAILFCTVSLHKVLLDIQLSGVELVKHRVASRRKSR